MKLSLSSRLSTRMSGCFRILRVKYPKFVFFAKEKSRYLGEKSLSAYRKIHEVKGLLFKYTKDVTHNPNYSKFKEFLALKRLVLENFRDLQIKSLKKKYFRLKLYFNHYWPVFVLSLFHILQKFYIALKSRSKHIQTLIKPHYIKIRGYVISSKSIISKIGSYSESSRLEIFHLKRLSLKQGLAITSVVLVVFIAQTQLYRTQILTDRSTQTDFVSINGGSVGDLNFEFDFDATPRSAIVKSLLRPVVSVSKLSPTVIFEDYSGNQIQQDYEIVEISNTEYSVKITPKVLPPGEYRAKLGIYRDGVYYEQQQRFVYGVLAVNTSKATYLSGETVNMHMAALRNDGHTICDAGLDLTIINPKGAETKLDVQKSGKCLRNNVIDVPDYSSVFQATIPGEYKILLSNRLNDYKIEDTFMVVEELPYSIERYGPTRIYPFVPYDFKIKVKANEDYKGSVIERVPESFEIDKETTIANGKKEIKWDVNLKKGEEVELKYNFDAPDVSPELYLVGPVSIGEYSESRLWQIAGDADTTVVFTTPGSTSWTIPADVTSITVETWGGGGGGKGGTVGLPGGGGGGGAYSREVIAVTPSASFNAVVGSGGTAGTANGGSGGNGGSSSFSANTTNTRANGGSGATTTSGGTAASANPVADFSYAGGNGGNGFQSAVTHVGSASAATTSVTFPTHAKGDLIIIMAFRDGSVTLPTIPANWVVLETSTTTLSASVLAYKVANSSSETSGTWTNATELSVQIYRGHAGVGIWGGNGAVSNSINYPAVSLTVTNGTSWVAGFAGHRSATNVEGAPSGMTNKTSAGTEIAGHDTNAGVASWSSNSVTVSASSGWLSWVVEVKAATTSSTLSYIGSAAGVNSLTMPTHQVGDLLMIVAYRDGNTTAPTIPTGWHVWGAAAGANLNSSVGAYKIAKTTSETSGTWTNATGVEVHIYRGHGGFGGVADNGAASTTVTYAALTMQVADGSSWVAGFAGHRSVDTNLQNAPSGMTNRTTYVDATNEIAGHDTAGGVTSWSNTNVSVGGTSSGWRARTVEIKAAVQGFGAGGGASSAGTSSAGTAGNNNTNDSGGGTATAPTGGGNGSAGGNDSSAGTNGVTPGGAGGGGGNLTTIGNAGGAGANGKVTITYTDPVYINVLGSCKQSDQSTNCTDVGTVRVAVNGNLKSQIQTTVAGTWTISGVLQPQSGDVVTVFIEDAGETDEAIAVTTYDGTGDIDGLELIAQRLSIGNTDNRTVTNANLSQYDNGVSGDEDIFHEVDGTNDLTMIETGKSLSELYIKTGNTYRPASDNTGNVTVNDFEIPTGGIFTADSNTINLTGDGTPFVVAGTLNENTSIIKYTSTSATTITPETYYHLHLQPSSTGSPTYTLGNALLRTRDLVVGDGTNALTVNWDTHDPTINIEGNFTLNASATWIKSGSASLGFIAGASPVTLTDNNSTKQDLGRLTINGGKELDLGSSISLQRMNVTSGNTLDLQSSSYTLKITGSGTTTSRPFVVDGSLTEGNSTIEYNGTSTTDVDDETFYNLYLNQSGTTFTGYGSIAVSNVFTINAGTFNAGANTITLSGSSTPFVVTGTFTEGTSTFNYTGTSATNVTADTYHNLQIGYVALGSSVTYTTLSGSHIVLNDLDVGFASGSGTATMDVNANDATVDIAGDIRINTKGLYSASSNSAAPLTVAGDFTNNGTFTHNNGKVAMDGAVDTSQSILGTMTFYTLEIQTGDREIKLGTTGTKTIGANGTLTMTGSSCENMTRIRSSSATTQSTLAVDVSASASVSHVDLQDINLTTKSITAANSVNSGNNSGNWTISANGCLGTSLNSNPTGSSFQRKVIYDDQNSRYWMFNHDGDEIEIKYSSDEGSTWTNPSTAGSGRLPYDTNDFSVWWKSISTVEYIVVAVADGGDIKVRQGTLSGTDITWDTDVSVALNEVGTYSNPYAVLDSADHLWVGATYYNSTNYVYKTTVTTGVITADPSTWTWSALPYQLSNNQTNSNVYGTISALSSEDMYATFVVNTDLLGCRWDDSDSTWKDGIGATCTASLGEGSEITYFDSLETNLVTHWKMNEGSWSGASGEVTDSTTSNIDGTAQGNATTNAQAFQRAGTFDGVNDYVQINDSTTTRVAESGDSFTISLWIKANSTQINAENNIDIIGTESTTSTTKGWVIRYYQGTTPSHMRFLVHDGTSGVSVNESGIGITDDVWRHVVGVVNRNTNTASLYQEGVLLDELDISGLGSFEKNVGLQIGVAEIGDVNGGLREFTGGIDDVRMYDRALSAGEVAKLYQLVPDSVNIDDASDFGALPSTGNQVVRSNSGNLYSLEYDGGSCEMWKSPNGITWTLVDSETCDNSTIAIAKGASDIIGVVYSDNSASNLVEYMTFDTSTDTFGSSTQISNSVYVLTDISVATDSSGATHIAWSEWDDGTSTQYVYYKNSVGGFGSTITVQSTSGSPYANIGITLNNSGIPIVTYTDSANNDLNAEIGDTNDATSFTGHTVDGSINLTSAQIGASVATSYVTGYTWIAYVDDTSNYIALAKYTGDYSSGQWNGTYWTTITTNTNVGFEPSIAITGNDDLYVIYENDQDDMAYDVYDGTSWAAETVLHTGTFQDIKAKWAYKWNDFGTNNIDYLYSDGTDVYYDHLYLRRTPTNINNASDLGGMLGSGRQIIRNNSGYLYAVLVDSAEIDIWKSTDEGNSWTEMDTADNPSGLDQIVLSAAIDSTDIIQFAYAKFDGTTNFDTIYATYNTTTDQFSSPVNIDTASTTSIGEVVITIDAHDVPHVVYRDGSQLSYSNNIGGSWTAVQVENITTASALDITINDDSNIPEISYINSTDDDLTLAIGNTNDATSFTLQDVDTTVDDTSGTRGTSIGIDTSGNTWVAYKDSDGFLNLAKHLDASAWSSWESLIETSQTAHEPSIALDGSDIYVFYEDDQEDVVHDMYDGSVWSGETVIEMHGALQDLKAKWSYINNYDSTGTAPVQTNTFYFDGSDVGATDPNTVWTNDSNAYDTSNLTAATSTTIGSTSSNYLMAEGTNAPPTGGAIQSVKLRLKAAARDTTLSTKNAYADVYTNSLAESLGNVHTTTFDTLGVWTDYVTLTTPTGGWSWDKIQSLEVKNYCGSDTDLNSCMIFITEILVLSTKSDSQSEIDYLYSDGTDVFYNRLLIGAVSIPSVQDPIVTGLSSGLHKNISSVSQTLSGVDYIHLAYVNSSGNIYYDRYDGDWDFTASSLDSDSDNTYLSMSLDSATNDAYLGYIASGNDDVYMKKATYSAGPSWSWGTSTTFKTDASEIYTNYNANYSSSGKLGSILALGDLSPFNLDWEVVLATAANNAPTVTSVSVNGGTNINLTENSTVDISWTATITDDDGQAEIAGVTGKFYKSNVSGAQACTNDNNDCYEDTSCNLTSCSGDTCTATCTSAIYFHADATDANSGQTAEYWRGWMEATDSHSDTGTGFSATNAPDINSLAAVDVVTTIDYGALIPNDNSTQQATLVTNTGNVIIDTELSGDNMCVDYPTCASYSIAVGQQEYSISGFTYGSGTDLTSSDVRVQLNLAKSTTSPANSTANLYWRLGVPAIQQIGIYSGENTLTVVNDNL